MSEPNISYTEKSGLSITLGPLSIIHFIISILTLGVSIGYIRANLVSADTRIASIEAEQVIASKERIDMIRSLSILGTKVDFLVENTKKRAQ